jgi:hypothetical protein
VLSAMFEYVYTGTPTTTILGTRCRSSYKDAKLQPQRTAQAEVGSGAANKRVVVWCGLPSHRVETGQTPFVMVGEYQPDGTHSMGRNRFERTSVSPRMHFRCSYQHQTAPPEILVDRCGRNAERSGRSHAYSSECSASAAMGGPPLRTPCRTREHERVASILGETRRCQTSRRRNRAACTHESWTTNKTLAVGPRGSSRHV